MILPFQIWIAWQVMVMACLNPYPAPKAARSETKE
jgi:hypothetical protein